MSFSRLTGGAVSSTTAPTDHVSLASTHAHHIAQLHTLSVNVSRETTSDHSVLHGVKKGSSSRISTHARSPQAGRRLPLFLVLEDNRIAR